MTKILLVLFIGLVCEAIGVVLLKEGINSISQGRSVGLQNAFPLILKGLAHPKIWLGVAFEFLFFLSLLYLMSLKDISFVWPMTSLSFVMTTIAAVVYLKEPVSAARWMGVALIMVGAGIITWNEKQIEQAKERAAAVAPVPTNPNGPTR